MVTHLPFMGRYHMAKYQFLKCQQNHRLGTFHHNMCHSIRTICRVVWFPTVKPGPQSTSVLNSIYNHLREATHQQVITKHLSVRATPPQTQPLVLLSRDHLVCSFHHPVTFLVACSPLHRPQTSPEYHLLISPAMQVSLQAQASTTIQALLSLLKWTLATPR